MSFSDNWLHLKTKNEEKDIPLDQIKDLVISNSNCSITVPLINELSARCINTVFCDTKRNPSAVLTPINQSPAVVASIHSQVQWNDDRKKDIWTRIVLNKMNNQMRLLEILGLEGTEEIETYIKNTEVADITNREGQAARIYFRNLFGRGFVRNSDNDINYMLNYGYAVLRSSINRVIVMHGYNQALGIWHNNKQNPFNLTCDIMEPFRPFIDRIVYNNSVDGVVDKGEVLRVLQADVTYKGRKMNVSNAIDLYFEDIADCFENSSRELGEVCFVA